MASLGHNVLRVHEDGTLYMCMLYTTVGCGPLSQVDDGCEGNMGSTGIGLNIFPVMGHVQCSIDKDEKLSCNIDGLVQDCSISNVLAMEIL